MTTWVVALLLTLSSPASALLMRHHDLRSLFFDAEVVVKVVTLSERTVDYVTTARYRVVESYQGPYKPGDVIEASGLGSYGFQDVWDTTPPPPPDPERVVFLEKGRHAKGWWVASSGLRVRQGGHWKGFQQEMNPGLYAPVPQAAESGAAVTADEREHGLRDAAFERELTIAKRRADAVRKAIASGTTKELVELCGPPPGAATPSNAGFFDTATGALLARVAALRKVGDLLEGIARVGSVDSGWRLHHAPVADVLLVAQDPAAPRRHRLAALQLLEALHHWLPAAATPKLLALVRDPDAKVRSAVLRMAAVLPTKAVKAAVEATWPSEKDPMVRVDMLRIAAHFGWRGALSAPRPFEVAAERRQQELRLRYAFHRAGWALAHVDVELTHVQTGAVVRPKLEAIEGRITGAAWGSYTGALDGVRAPPGTYHVALRPHFRDPTGALHPARVTAEDWDVLPNSASDGVASSSATAPLPSATPLEKRIALPERSAHCSCDGAGRGSAQGGWAWLLVVALGSIRRRPSNIASPPA